MTQTVPNGESTTLLAYLNEQRTHVIGILDGLDEEALRRPLLPSGWTCLGMIQHLATSERFWFQCIVAGDQAAIAGLADDGEDWIVAPDVSVETVFDRYRQAIDRASAIIAATPMDAAPAWWPSDQFGGWRLEAHRQIVLHVMNETACHAGHLDVVREMIDGRQWFVLPG